MGHVLVVDDDRATRETITAVLEDAGFTVAVEADADRALAFLKTSPLPLVVLLDLFLAGHEHNPVLMAIAADPALGETHRVIVMTAGTAREAEAALAPIRSSVAELLMKPFDIEGLIGTVAQAARSLPGP